MDRGSDFWRNEVVAFLALSTIKGVGYWTLFRLMLPAGEGFKDFLKNSPISVLEKELEVSLLLDEESPEEWQHKVWEAGLQLARELAKHRTRLVFRDQEEFPGSLKETEDGPRWLFIQGDIRALHNRPIAVVGTRKPSKDGEFLARYVVAALAHSERTVVSGLAFGIDQVAHQESLRYGLPTVAVLGNGIFLDYPKGSQEIREKILMNGGAVITEYLPHQTYSGQNFVRRNRIQAGLSEFVIPVEWKVKSGTAHTVEYASKYQRKVVNVFLPGTAKVRPELDFSERSRGAVSFEIPRETEQLLELLDLDAFPVRLETEQSKEVAAEPVQQSLKI
ncbi:DNA-processing protein DprA [Vreelandella venusta]|uniref:DNA-processing protein DprA n=1 Tax=Halomonadaceae TaxID=28256 RepID=UPI000B5B2353|nr:MULTISPECIES: DNA-processing protein DprA [Halomonas]ASK21206.1 DNA processing protein DprA [Halomonas sp. N3-2A]QPI63983.1 DNA-protecting protein DprA [Halomonas venusta]